MSRPYSLDFRQRAVVLVRGGRSRREVARLFGVGEASVIRWCQRAEATGSPAAKPMGQRPGQFILLPERDWRRPGALESNVRNPDIGSVSSE